MSTDQTILFSLLLFVFVFLIWGHWRYDLVAFAAMVSGLLLQVIPYDQAFSGFGHPAVIIIALVFSGIVGVLWVGARDVRADLMSVGELVQFVIYAIMVAGGLLSSLGIIPVMVNTRWIAAGASRRRLASSLRKSLRLPSQRA